jgi:hypothetical protein
MHDAIRIARMLALCFCLNSFAVLGAKAAENKDDVGLKISGVPALSYSSDYGFGAGAAGMIYRLDKKIKPYSWNTELQIFATTKGMHSHYLRADFVEAGGLPLRIRPKIGFFALLDQNYCGPGLEASCANELIPEPVGKNTLTEEGREAYMWQYYRYRYIEPYAQVEFRYRVHDAPDKIELMFSYRGSYYIPGDFSEYGPYVDSLYARERSATGDEGYASVPEIGVMFDGRDQEAATTSGYWIESSVRGASKYIGSAWDYIGVSLSARTYVPFDTARRWVLANQFIFDSLFGDMPLQEMVRIGGSLGYTAFGGAEIGRGLRQQYYPGRVKFILQTELRYRFIEFELLDQRFNSGALLFADNGIIAWDYDQFASAPFKFPVGFGGGLRLVWNNTFVIRLDVAVSPTESYQPRFYFKVGNVF